MKLAPLFLLFLLLGVASTHAAEPVKARPAQSSKFDHNQKAHQQTPCAQCHIRASNAAASTFPHHEACMACHATENYLPPAAGNLCQACHPAAGTLSADGKTQLRSYADHLTQFGLAPFSHRTHLDPKYAENGRSAQCRDCHASPASAREPVTLPAHRECYSCHAHQPGQKKAACQDCHVAAPQAMRYSPEPAAPTKQFRFTHATHQRRKASGSPIECAECHRLRTDLIERPATPRGLRHKSSCWDATCHVREREAVCAKCHAQGVPR